tara:strand:+ start:2608 stop:3009 length:402 start_codon:yes stop_codon:yes gene_type:complete
MKKVKKINHNNIKNIVKEHFLSDNNLLPESKIDSIIKEYLSERDDFLEDESALEDKIDFSKKTSNALRDMVDGINEMVGDLEVIKEKEGNVLVYQDEYADEILEDVVRDLEKIVDRINDLTELGDDDIDLNYE